MRRLEVRRHSFTKKDAARGRGSHLSGDGVAAARAVGAALGPVGYVLTSESPRAVETAVAMGFAVDDTAEMPSGYVPGEVDHHDQWRWERPFVTYAELIAAGRGLADVALANRALWLAALRQVPEGGTALSSGTAAPWNRPWSPARPTPSTPPGVRPSATCTGPRWSSTATGWSASPCGAALRRDPVPVLPPLMPRSPHPGPKEVG
ncbi:hypothetical protein AB0B31_20150 [Catellatospora citrea]|uniref:hypothetical protein n=1 Tax=Catellatospora citrea TaxID=53366 RepID=UPI0033D53F37